MTKVLIYFLFAIASWKISAETIQGIVLTEANRSSKLRKGITINLKGSAPTLKSLLQPYLGKPLESETLADIRATIVDYLEKDQKKFALVLVPEQEVKNGIIVLQVVYGRVGTISYTGQNWFSIDALKRGTTLREGSVLNQDLLSNDVSWINHNPFRFTEAIVSPGSQPGFANIELVTRDMLPVRFVVGADNMGVQITGEGRVYGTASWGNAFFLGDLFTYQYLATSDFHRLQTHTINYTSFLSIKHLLLVTGSYAQIYPAVPNFHTVGKTLYGSARYQIPIKPLYAAFRSTFETGVDFKYLNSNLFFESNPSELPIATTSVNISEFVFTYACLQTYNSHQLNFKVEMYACPWKNGFPHQSNFAYGQLRPGSQARFAYWRFILGDKYKWASGWGARSQFRMQVASGPLIASEQFSLGGANSVRGYNESQFIADNALCLNLEAFSPSYSFYRKMKDDFYGLLFFDIGYGINYSAASGTPKDQILIGIGPGLRYEISQYATFRADYGFELHSVVNGDRFGRFHLAGTMSY